MKDQQADTRTLTATTELLIGGNKLKLKLVVPESEIPPEALLTTLYELSDRIVDGVEQKSERLGSKISCKKGCGACCRQHVPISPAEARLVAQIVDELPGHVRSIIEKRFEQAAQRLKASGIMDQAMNYHRLSQEETISMTRDYFRLGIACPFLEDESCSIYPFRPLICREYLVISAPSHCAKLDLKHIKRLKFPVSLTKAFSEMDGVRKKGENQYIPLVMALEWVQAHPEGCENRPGPKWIQNFFQNLSGSKIPDPD